MKNKTVELSVQLMDVLTPLSCSSMIIEFIKYVIYQKQLIPYPYERLKMYINKYKEASTKENEMRNMQSSKYTIASNRYFKKTESVYNSLENIFNILNEEIENELDTVVEVVILLGPTYLYPQEVFRIPIPSLNRLPTLKNHSIRKNKECLIRSMLQSDDFHALMSSSSAGNMHVMLKLHGTPSDARYVFRERYQPSGRAKETIVRFHQSAQKMPSSDFVVFRDEPSLTEDKPSSSEGGPSARDDEPSAHAPRWYQIRAPVSHFVDEQFEGVSIPNMWMCRTNDD